MLTTSAWLQAFAFLPAMDWLALTAFFSGWIGYAWFARRLAHTQPSILASTNRIRHAWMLQSTYRENRVVDGSVVQNLSTSPSFFASTTILIIGGLLAVLGTTDKANEFVREIPFAVRTSVLVFDLKLVVMVGIFVYAFFRFTWSMRQYTFGALLMASLPEARQFELQEHLPRQVYAEKAGRVMSMAAETFNDGLRAYYFSFAAIAWFFSPWLFMAGSASVIYILYQREFHSDVLAVLNAPSGADGVNTRPAPPP
jgi:uncharacterized membrane protein